MATGRSAFLINTAYPELAPSNVFVVAEGGVRITASGIYDTDYVELQKQTSPAVGASPAIWTPVVRQGQVARLSVNNMEYIELITGIYRVVFVGGDGSALVVFMAEDQALLDAKLIYNYPAYNPHFNGSVTGDLNSPALVSSRDRLGHWCYDTSRREYTWVEAVVDTSNGVVTYSYFNAPGGFEVVPQKLIQQPRAYPSCEQLLFYQLGNESGPFDITNVPSHLAVKKITVLVDTGSCDLFGSEGTQMTIAAGESYSFEVTSEMGEFEHVNGTYFSVWPNGGATARIMIQCCHVSPLCTVVEIGDE
jgi:hypothetical protein